MAANTHGLTELGYTILLDRYAQKDKDRNNIAVGDIVVAIIRGSGKDTYQRREIAKVSRLFESNSRKYAEILLLFSQETIELPLDHLDKPLELTPEQVQKRVAKGAASIEDESVRQKVQNEFEWALSDFKFIPGGRILAAAGTDQELTYMNCFVIPSPHDSRGGIMKSLTQMTEIMSRGGGVGMNLSSLRPNRAYVKGVNGRSSGSVSWGSLFSYVTGLIEQGGCFAGDTRVPTDKGLLRIDEIVRRHKNGERFYTKTHTGWKKVTDVFENGVQPLIEIELRRGYTVRVTPNHPMAYLDNGEIAFIPAEEVSLSDQLLTLIPKYAEMNTDYVKLEPLQDEEFDRNAVEHPLPEELNEDLAYLLGYSYGDGSIIRDRGKISGLSFSLSMDYPEIKNKLISIIEKLFDYSPPIFSCKGNCEKLDIHSVKIAEWLDKNGILKQKTAFIRVPEAIFKSPLSVQASFIAGYFDADGSISKSKSRIKICSISREMLLDIQKILASIGILSAIVISSPKDHKFVWYNLTVTELRFKKRFYELIKSEKTKRAVLAWAGTRKESSAYNAGVISGIPAVYTHGIYDSQDATVSGYQIGLIQNKITSDKMAYEDNVDLLEYFDELTNFIPDQIVSIRALPEEETYDITVEDEHVLSGNGVFTHNSRRGALLLMMDDWHPDVFEYINSKREAGKVTNANISVNFSDAFMEALKNDGDWELKFPDTSDPDYDTLWDGRLDKWIDSGKPVNVYQVVKAREIWNAVIESAWASAEPGLWFGDRANYWSNSRFYDDGYLISTNPCGEISLPSFGACNLGSINLSKMYDPHTKWIDFDKLYKTATIAARFLDNILDITPYPIPETANQQLIERRVGIGTMGIAELLVKIGVRYGSDEGQRIAEQVFKTVTLAAYAESARLAKEKGAFPRYSDEMMDRPFMRKIMDAAPMMDDDGEKITFEEHVSRYGMRNITLVTQPPTGTTGTLANTSTGIEPFFSWKFYRKGRLGIFEENVQVVQEWLNENPDKTIDDLPFYFVTAMDLTPEEHVKILATAQKWNDSSISKTCNVPNEYTVEEVGELYQLMYDLGAKGGTIYRDGSRDEQVLNLTREQAEKGNQKNDGGTATDIEPPVVSPVVPQAESVVEQPEPVLVPTPHGKVSRPKILSGKTFMKSTDWGTFFVTVNELENGDPYEVFVTIGKSGSDVQAFCEAMGRLISLALRYGNGNRRQILAKAVEQIRDIGGGQPSGFGPNKIFSIPDAVAKIIEDYYINGQNALEGIEIKIHETKPEVENMPAPIKVKRSPKRDVCPECGNMTLVREEGCYKCQSCGYSKC